MKPGVQCRIQKSSLKIPNQPQFFVLTLISSRTILILSFHLLQDLPKGRFPLDFSVKILQSPLHSSILATYAAHLNLLDLETLTILGEWYKL